MAAQTDKRAIFDFEVDFSNGGGIQGQGFRLDIDGHDISDLELADSIIRDLRLLMVGEVRILNKRIIDERHKRSPKAVNRDSSRQSRLIDLSHVVRSGETTYPGLPAPLFEDYLSHEGSRGRYAEGVSFQIGRATMVANSGTAIDAPYHRFPDTPDVAALPLASIADVPGVVVRLAGMSGRAVGRDALAATDAGNRAVLIETGWSERWGDPHYFVEHPFLARGGAEYLREKGAVLVGIDSLNIDDTSDPARPAHTLLLGAGIPIVENLNGLSSLPVEGFSVSAVPMRAEGMGAFPVRAWARIVLPA
jgi:kynurenine formamidase